MAERPDAEKLTHAEVRFENPSRHSDEFCRICEHFIKAEPPRCEAVQSPIPPRAWCKRWEPG